MDFKSRFNDYKDDFERYMHEYISSLEGIHDTLKQAMKYSLCSGGKRIRPVIMLAFCDAFGGDKRNVYPFACALEMIHTYSLIHDDLPCMDDDIMRRGKPCNHVVFGEDIALLAGDALLTQAFEIASDAIVDENLLSSQIKSVNILSRCAGSSGMISGQCFDLKMDFDSLSYDDVLNLYYLKTSKLFSAAGSVGALMAGANDVEVKAAENYGKNLGIAFQLVDDILDDDDKFLKVFNYESPKKVLERVTESAKYELGKLGRDIRFFEDLSNELMHRTY